MNKKRKQILANKLIIDQKENVRKGMESIRKYSEQLRQVKELAPRITELLELYQNCREAGILFPEDCSFMADGTCHNVGFMTGVTKHGTFAGIGIQKGGASGPYDFFTDGKMFCSCRNIDAAPDVAPQEPPRPEDMDKFLREFEGFEKSFLRWFDSLSPYWWRDIVFIHGTLSAEEFPISGEMNGDNVYDITDFISAVAEKYGVDEDDVFVWSIDRFRFDPEDLPYGAESCGCYINGVPEWHIDDERAMTEADRKEALALWHSLEDVPMNPETEKMEAPWNGFPTGTPREKIWKWFREQFGEAVLEELLGYTA